MNRTIIDFVSFSGSPELLQRCKEMAKQRFAIAQTNEFQSQNVVHMFKNAAGDRYVGEIKENSSMADPMQMTIADDGTECAIFVKEGHGELHYANQDLYVGQFRSADFRQEDGR